MRQDLITIIVESMEIPWLSLCVWHYEQEYIWIEIKKNLNDNDLGRSKGFQGEETVTETIC